MSVRFAFAAIILIWSTTPLAVKWSGEQVGFLFGVTGRMLIAFVVSALLLLIIRQRLTFRRVDLLAYFAIGIPLYIGMASVYWGAQYIPSGLISVVFGLAPILTAIVAYWVLKENHFTPLRMIGMALGVVGLAAIFFHSDSLGDHAIYGIVGTLVAVTLHSLSTVWLKRLTKHVSAIAANCGGLMVAVVLFTITWFVTDGELPATIVFKTGAAIVYLALASSVLGGVLYFYLLKRVDTGKIALLTLISPVFALLLGSVINHEMMEFRVVVGIVIVLLGVVLYFAQDIAAPLFNRQQTTHVDNEVEKDNGGQSRHMSILESGVSVAAGYVLTVLTQLWIFPLFGVAVALQQAAAISLVLVLIAFVKNYSLRRLFNFLQTRME